MMTRTLVAITLAGFALTAVPALADKHKDDRWVPPGLSKEEQAEWKNGRPPGWSQGQKKGWRGRSCPPGQAKKGRCPDGPAPAAASAPLDPFQQAIERIREWGRIRKISSPTLDAMLVSFSGAVHYGVPIPVAETFVTSAAERGVAAAGIEVLARALVYGTQRGVPPQHLEQFAESGLSRGAAAEAVALGLYRLGADARR